MSHINQRRIVGHGPRPVACLLAVFARTPREIGRDLGVDFLVEGSVRWNEGEVRITARLIQTSDETQLWSASYDYDTSDVFAVQSEVSSRLTAEQALSLDPDLAEAHLALSTVELFYDWDLEAAGHSARRALQVAPGMAQAHTHYAAWLAAAGRHDEAIEAARMGQQLDPLTQSVIADLCWYPIAPFAFGIMHALAGELEPSLHHLERAIDERSWWVVYLHADPRLDALRDDPRFEGLVRRVGLRR